MSTDGRTLPWRVVGRGVKPYAGKDEAVVTDANILAAVTAIVAADPPKRSN